MVAGKFQTRVSRLMPSVWLGNSEDSGSGNLEVIEAASEKRALILAQIHTRRFREYAITFADFLQDVNCPVLPK